VVAALGVLTVVAPMLAHVPAAQALLTGLGCRSLLG
jgi:hypothetical protein